MSCHVCHNPAFFICPCETILYCGKECQELHHGTHKEECSLFTQKRTFSDISGNFTDTQETIVDRWAERSIEEIYVDMSSLVRTGYGAVNSSRLSSIARAEISPNNDAFWSAYALRELGIPPESISAQGSIGPFNFLFRLFGALRSISATLKTVASTGSFETFQRTIRPFVNSDIMSDVFVSIPVKQPDQGSILELEFSTSSPQRVPFRRLTLPVRPSSDISILDESILPEVKTCPVHPRAAMGVPSNSVLDDIPSRSNSMSNPWRLYDNSNSAVDKFMQFVTFTVQYKTWVNPLYEARRELICSEFALHWDKLTPEVISFLLR